ncbi:MAG: hypothetical protein Q8O88_01575 [bacterium]|nr:hypothetical protein [bacterium]
MNDNNITIDSSEPPITRGRIIFLNVFSLIIVAPAAFFMLAMVTMSAGIKFDNYVEILSVLVPLSMLIVTSVCIIISQWTLSSKWAIRAFFPALIIPFLMILGLVINVFASGVVFLCNSSSEGSALFRGCSDFSTWIGY